MNSAKACREIAPGVYYFEVGKRVSRSNVYFARSGSSWVLIDSASANCGRLIRKTAESLFGANARPASILLTHDHPDHAGSALELARTWDCPVYVHPDELRLAVAVDLSVSKQYANPLDRWVILPMLRTMPAHRLESMLSKMSIKDVVQAFDPGAAVPGLPDWECIPTPGHTPGHVAFFRSSDRVLIAGDAILTADLNSLWGCLLWGLRLTKQRVSGSPWYLTWNMRAAKESVAALARLEPRVLACGHGIPMTGDQMARELRAFADHFSGSPALRFSGMDSRSQEKGDEMSIEVLVAYATKHGATAEIAEKIGQVLRQAGLRTDVLPADRVSDLTPYQAVVLGSAVYIGKWRKQAVKFLQANEKVLAEKLVWLFSSGPTGEGDPLELTQGWHLPEKLQPIADRIRPRDIAVFHGALDRKKLSFIEKWMIKKVEAPLGDFRDWEAITSWAASIAGVLKEASQAQGTQAEQQVSQEDKKRE